MEKENLKIIHEKNLRNYLEKVGVFGFVKKGKAKCEFCNEMVTLENIYALFPYLRQVKFVCEKPTCIRQFSIYIRGKHYASK